jgi:diacylglycerol kinase (CTP)
MRRTLELSQIFSLPFRVLSGSGPRARTDLHLARKAWHMGMGLMICAIYAYSGMSRSTAVGIRGSALGMVLLLETARFRIPSLNAWLVRSWGLIIRSSEVNQVTGTPFYVGASLLAIAIFPKLIALLSILFLACGDPIASMIGILYGRLGPRFGNGKSLVGTLAGVVVCAVIAGAAFLSLGLDFPTWVLLTLLGGLSGGAAEMLPVEIDDNFSIPIVSGFTLWLAFIFLGL